MTRTELIQGIRACRKITGRKVSVRGYCYKRTIWLQRVYENESRAANRHVTIAVKKAGRVMMRALLGMSQPFCEARNNLEQLDARINLEQLDAGLDNRIGESVERALADKEPTLW